MMRFLQQTAYEFRLCVRSKTVWVLGALSMITAFSPSFLVLFVALLVENSVTRDERSGFSSILSAVAYNTAQLYMARALAVLCLLVAIWPFMLSVTGFLTGMAPEEWLFTFSGSSLVFLTLKYITVCMSIIAAVFLFGLITDNRWKLYFIIGAFWLVWVLATSNLLYFPSWSALFVFGYGDMRPVALATVVGELPQQGLVPYYTAFQMAFAMLLLAVTAAGHEVKRGGRIARAKLLVLLASLAIIICLSSGLTVFRELADRESSFRFGFAEAIEREATEEAAVMPPKLEEYRLAIKLRTEAHSLEGTATLRFDLAGYKADTLIITLRNCFSVTDVLAADSGEKLHWRRNGSRLIVRLPEGYPGEKPLTLTVAYAGQAWEWFPGRWSKINIVAPSFSLLRSGYAWYPVPGDYPLYSLEAHGKLWSDSRETTIWPKSVVHQPVPFELTVDIDNDSTVATNLDRSGTERLSGDYKMRYRFSSPQGRDVFLLTGPYRYEKRAFPGRDSFVEVYYYRQHEQNIDKVLASLIAPYSFYDEVFMINAQATGQQAKACTVVEIPPVFLLAEDGIASRSMMLTDTVLLSENYMRSGNRRFTVLDDIAIQKRDMAVLQRWWPEDMTVGGWSRDDTIAEGIMLYLFTLYPEEARGRDFYGQIKRNLLADRATDAVDEQISLPFLTRRPVVRDVFIIFDTIRTSGLGDQADKEIIRELYRVYLSKKTIEPIDFSEAVEAVLTKEGRLQDKTEEIRQRLKNITKHTNDPKNKVLYLQ